MPEAGPIARVGFVGLGNMGWPMAHLLAPHFELTVLDARTDVAVKFAAEHGVTATTSLASLAAASDAVITMLPTGDDVRAVALGGEDSGGLVAGMAAGSVLIDMSSSAPLGTRQLAQDLEPHGIALVDAPVSGGVAGARGGTLAVMVGGDQAQIERCRPVLEHLGKAIYEMGGSGTGHAMKALNNYCSAAALSSACEALIVGDRMGLEPATMVAVLNASSGRSAATEGKIAEEILGRDFSAGFTVGLMAKDVGIAGGLAEGLGLEAPILARTRDLWRDAAEQLGGASGVTEIVKLWEPKPTDPSRRSGRPRRASPARSRRPAPARRCSQRGRSCGPYRRPSW